MFSSMQPSLLLSPSSGGLKQQPQSIGSSSSAPVQFSGVSSSSGTVALPQQPAMPSDIDEKSLKDCIEIIQRQVNKLRSLNELSNVLQIDNISNKPVHK